MLTTSAAFDDLKHRRSTTARFILKLTDGSTTEYYARGPMNLSTDSIVVHGLVTAFEGLSHGYDPYRLVYQPANMRVKFAGQQWQKDDADANWRRALDHLNIFWGQDATLYLYPGEYVSSLSDCLIIFTGTVTKIYSNSPNDVGMDIDERLNINHRILPQDRITRADWPDVPDEAENKRAPIIWGSLYDASPLRYTGFAIGEPVGYNKWLIANHVADNMIGSPWFFLAPINSWCDIITGDTQTANDGGKATLALTAGFEFYAYLRPFRGSSNSTGTDGANDVGPSVAWDDDSATKFSAIADTTTTAVVTFEWNQEGDSANSRLENNVAEIYASSTAGNVGLMYHITDAAGATITAREIEIYDGNAWQKFEPTATTGSIQFQDFVNSSAYEWTDDSAPATPRGTFWHLNSGPRNGTGEPLKVRFKWTGSGYTANSTVVAYIHTCVIRMKCRYPRQAITLQTTREGPGIFTRVVDRGQLFYVRLQQSDRGPERVGCEVDGRAYGSWIDGGRTNSYNSGDLINKAPGIIESILRDELGLTGSDIDTGSFDTLQTTGNGHDDVRTLVLNDGNARDSKDVIDQLCYEDALVLIRRQSGTWRLLDAVTLSGENAGTLRPDDLVGRMPSVWLGDLSKLMNEQVVNYRPHASVGRALYFATQSDSTSQTAYGTIEGRDRVNESAVEETGDDNIDTYLFGSTVGMLSRRHGFVRLRTAGIKWADVEVGDYFYLDSTYFDSQMLFLGATWASKKLHIFRKQHFENAVEFDTVYLTPLST